MVNDMKRKLERISKKVVKYLEHKCNFNLTSEEQFNVVGLYQGWEDGEYTTRWSCEFLYLDKWHTFDIHTKKPSVEYLAGYVMGFVDEYNEHDE